MKMSNSLTSVLLKLKRLGQMPFSVKVSCRRLSAARLIPMTPPRGTMIPNGWRVVPFTDELLRLLIHPTVSTRLALSRLSQLLGSRRNIVVCTQLTAGPIAHWVNAAYPLAHRASLLDTTATGTLCSPRKPLPSSRKWHTTSALSPSWRNRTLRKA